MSIEILLADDSEIGWMRGRKLRFRRLRLNIL
jgi:hypothetical protein